MENTQVQVIDDSKIQAQSQALTMNDLVNAGAEIKVVKTGDVVEGTVLKVGKNEVLLDIDAYGIGIVRGRELYDDQVILSNIKIGDRISAMVVEGENVEGTVELSLRQAGQERVWNSLKEKLGTKEIVKSKILSANKGGLMVEINGVAGFLPVSQLSIEHYPRVEEGDKNKILSALQSYVGQLFDVQIITADDVEEKLIVSEKSVYEKMMEEKMSKLKIGDTVSGMITGVVNFGAFIKFGELEGLIHISEIAWQRVENPKDMVKVGDMVKAKIIAIEKGRISLSMKALSTDPWLKAVENYKIGQIITGKVSKIMPFGIFVEIEKDIQGLAHLQELSSEAVKDPSKAIKLEEERQFKVIGIDPKEHRLTLSMKGI